MKEKKQNRNVKKFLISILIFSGLVFVFLNINLDSFGEIYQYVDANSRNGTAQAADTLAVDGNIRTGEVTMNANRWADNPFTHVLLWILLAIGNLIALTAKLITFSLSETMMSIYDNDGIYTGWVIVRDFLNIFFIFFLVFSAFATVFQVSRYHIRSTWVMIVVMALLVNFSWPITRVMIDASNVTMSYIIGQTDAEDVAKGGLIARLSEDAEFAEMMIGKEYFAGDSAHIDGSEKSGLMVAIIIGIIIGAIFLFTIGTIGILLLIRVIVLAILLVFAPAGFVFAAFPSTRGTANQWWDALLKQIYLGPVALFSLLLAMNVMDAMSDQFSKTATDVGLVSAFKSLPTFAVAIILIWAGIIATQRISGQTASMSLNAARRVRGYGIKYGKGGARLGVMGVDRGLAGASNRAARLQGNNWLSRRAKNLGTAYDTARSAPERAKNIREGMRKRHESAIEEARTRGLASTGRSGGDKNAATQLENKKVAEMKKKWKDDNVDSVQLANKLDGAKGAEQRALIEHLTKQDDLGEGEMKKLVDKMGNLDHEKDAGLQKVIMKKVTTSGRGDLAIDASAKIIEAKEGLASDEARRKAVTDMVRGLNNQEIAKSSELLKMGGAGDVDVRHALNQRAVNLKVRQAIQAEMKSRDDFNNFNASIT